MNSQNLFLKTSLFFLIVLTHSALTNSVAIAFDDPDLIQPKTTLQKTANQPRLYFDFDGKLDKSFKYSADENAVRHSCFTSGLVNQSFRIGYDGLPTFATLAPEIKLNLSSEHDFSVEFWIRTTVNADQKIVVLSQKQIPDNSLQTHKQKGWAFGVCNGTWSWNIGSGKRRLTYERDNGQRMPINDGRWHQLVMTHEHSSSIVRLYYDGINWVTYNLADKDGFEFSNESPLTIGWSGKVDASESILPSIEQGAQLLQELVDEFHQLGLGELKPGELIDLVIAPEQLIQEKQKAGQDGDSESTKHDESSNGLKSIKKLIGRLSGNPYTVHQVADFMKVAPMQKLFVLKDRQVEIDERIAAEYSNQERLHRPEFDIDELSILERVVSSEEIRRRYSQHFPPVNIRLEDRLSTLTAASFNIHHGGKHETIAEDGWDSRETIADLIRRENIDVVMMQETYSSGDFIAAELGYYFATTVDWDYLNQGANISVLSRYPIKEIRVPPTSSFMNVAAKVSLSETQDIFVMSNWYGMNNFKDVFEFHETRFSNSTKIPILFAGDFNAVPHTDGGNSPASRQLLKSGFRDAYREKHPDTKKFPGPTHQTGSRIDQLYYKGQGLSN
ncbi:MAG: endonuclease/exonuclease/phosphatase family metal-dependent hydrolase, partial [Mariniblastus sp.]